MDSDSPNYSFIAGMTGLVLTILIAIWYNFKLVRHMVTR